ncbi:zinc finger CCCH domain protein [Parasponia andersonii]|uniref:Zinc finger CCCH domain protein n=1 Tax=Parasponia andersonii TaxID=3476 RepID=A0A2P5CMK9_PARAD|nr:zinc finger CCCH domain protein [Parasponia andersonii]
MGAEGEEAKEQENNPNPNPITQSQFLSWKRHKDADASARRAEAARKRAEDIAAGTVQMNGRELFTHQPWVFDNSRY